MLLLLSAALFTTASALADPPQGGSDPCRARHPGDPCEADEFEGVCRRRRCTRETDDGVRSFHCLVCESRHGGGHHHHHRHHGESLDAATDAPVEDAPDAPDVTDVTDVAPVARDAARPRAPEVRRPRGLFSCAARPGGGGGAWWVLAALAALSALRRGASAPSP